MKKYTFLVLAAVLFLFSGCDKEEKEVTFSLTFKALYDGAKLVKNKDYTYSDYTVQFTKFTSYFSDITLLNGNEETVISEVEYIDFTPDGASNDDAVDVTIQVKAKAGDYTGLRMGYGVNAKNNAKRPADFAAGSPLAQEVEYWGGWKSYIFNKIEGQGDADNNGQPDLFMIFHCGSDKVYREYTFEKGITVSENNTVAVEFDLKNLFFVNNQWYDLTAAGNAATSNSPTDVRVATILMDNFDNATSIK